MLANKKAVWLLMILFLALSSCASTEALKKTKSETFFATAVNDAPKEYLLGPGDELGIMYHIALPHEISEYILAPGDVIKVEFYNHSNIDRQLFVRPDGMITLPMKGDIHAAGSTPSELSKKIKEKFSDVFNTTMVTVTLVEYDVAIKKLKEELVAFPNAQRQVVTIMPDGNVSFPRIKEQQAAGLTLSQLKENVEKEYKKMNEGLSISLMLTTMKNNAVYVLGEVRLPGMFLMERPTTLTQILAQAQVSLDSAELKTVLVISRNEQDMPTGRLVNLGNVIGEADLSTDILLKQYDIVYVPKTKIAKVDQVVDQYLNKVIPNVFRGFGFTFGYDLNNNHNFIRK